MAALVLAAAIAVIAIVLLFVARGTRGRRRLLMQRMGIYAAVPSITALLVLFPLHLKLSFGDGLSLAGLVLSLFFGMGARALDRITSRLRIGIVIPSRVPFHSELRAGLQQGMSSVRLDLYDDYVATTQAEEKLSEFLPSLRRTLAWGPDYLVMCSPSVSLVSTDEVISQLRQFSRQGGGLVFIDNQPSEEARSGLRRYGRVISDVETGAKIIAGYVQQQARDGDEVLVLCGPSSSAPALMRKEVLTEAMPDAKILVADSGGWTADSAYAATVECFEQGGSPRFIVCGNDVMAFGAVRGIRQVRKTYERKRTAGVEVIGYDGITRALYSIADEDSPLVATICTPPSAYGQEIAAMILADVKRIFRVRSELRQCCIPVGEGQLITRYNVELVLAG
jgi:ABC-type sugar transport system substrate-binding protein